MTVSDSDNDRDITLTVTVTATVQYLQAINMCSERGEAAHIVFTNFETSHRTRLEWLACAKPLMHGMPPRRQLLLGRRDENKQEKKK